MFNTETRMFIFSCAYAAMKQTVTLRLFFCIAFKGAYPRFLPETNFKNSRFQDLLSTVTPTGALVKTFIYEKTCNKTSEESCKL